jgi:hypothetical protein
MIEPCFLKPSRQSEDNFKRLPIATKLKMNRGITMNEELQIYITYIIIKPLLITFIIGNLQLISEGLLGILLTVLERPFCLISNY